MDARLLMEAIERRDIDAAREALAAGAAVDGVHGDGSSPGENRHPLIAAIRTGSIRMVELPLDHGADPDRDTAVWGAPLAVASYRGDRAMIETLLDRGASVNTPKPRHPGPLEMAAWYNRPDLVALLLERGADPARVVSRSDGSLVRVQPAILKMLMAAGGQASSSIVVTVEAEMALLAKRGESPE